MSFLDNGLRSRYLNSPVWLLAHVSGLSSLALYLNQHPTAQQGLEKGRTYLTMMNGRPFCAALV